MGANLIVLNPQRGDSIALTAVTSAYNQPSAFQPIGQTVYSTASIPANANNALYGKAITISNFVNANNNGTFAILASTATSITVNNAKGVVVVAAGTATFQTTGTPSQYASKVENIWTNQNGDNVTVNANAGDTLIAIVIGLKQIVDFDQLHGTAPYFPQFGNSAGTIGHYPNGGFNLGQLAGLNDYNANPTVADFSGGAPVDITATSLAGAATLTVHYTNPGSSLYFTTGEVVTLSGTKEPWLNGLAVTVLAGSTAALFTATVTPPTLTLTASQGVYQVPTDQPSNPELENTTTYIGTITGGANDAFAGASFLVAGFVTHVGNNGTFVCVASTATTLTLANVAGVAEVHAATAALQSYTQAQDTGDAAPAGNTWTSVANSNIIGSDYTVSYPFNAPPTNGVVTPSKPGPSGGPAIPTSNLPTVLTPSSPYQSAIWNLDGYYPSVYVFIASNVVAGSYKINLNSMYQPGAASVTNEWAQGCVPIFDGGVNFQVFNVSGAAVSPVDAHSISLVETTANPATAPTTLTTTAADG